jgi:hypothetical protein
LGAIGYGRVDNLLVGEVGDAKFGAMARGVDKVVKELAEGVKGEQRVCLQYG